MTWRWQIGRWMLIALGIVVAISVLIVIGASLVLAAIRGVSVPMPDALWYWFSEWCQAGGNLPIYSDLYAAIAVPVAVVLFFGYSIGSGMFQRRGQLRPARAGEKPTPPIRAATATHGSADWMSMQEAREMFPGPHSAYGGVVIGEAYRVDQDRTIPQKRYGTGSVAFDPDDKATWGKGGKMPLLIDPCTKGATHGAIFAGSGGFKTTGVTIPTLATWTGSVVVLDPSCQVGPMTAAIRQSMGHKVVMIGPDYNGFNALDWIDPADPKLNAHVWRIVSNVAGDSKAEQEKGDNAVFETRGRELLACILADMLADTNLTQEQRTLREFRERVLTPEKEMPKRLKEIAGKSQSKLARDLARTLMQVGAPETFAGFYSNATGHTQWLSTYADMLSGNAFKTAELTSGKLTVFVQVPIGELRDTPEVARVIIGSLLEAAYRAKGNVNGRILFLLDEVNFLGKLRALEDARDAARKYGVTLVLMWQDLGQLIKTWGKETKSSWFNSCSWVMFAAVNDRDTAEEVSKMAGKYTIITQSQGESNTSQSGSRSGSLSKGRNKGMNEQARDLITPDEVRTHLRADEAIVFRSNAPPLRCGRAIYFRRQDMMELIGADRYRVAAE